MIPKTRSNAPRATATMAPPADNVMLTTRQRLEAIEAMRKRVNGYVDFMGTVETMQGSSAEAKDAAVSAFHDRLAALQKQLELITEGLRLG